MLFTIGMLKIIVFTMHHDGDANYWCIIAYKKIIKYKKMQLNTKCDKRDATVNCKWDGNIEDATHRDIKIKRGISDDSHPYQSSIEYLTVPEKSRENHMCQNTWSQCVVSEHSQAKTRVFTGESNGIHTFHMAFV